MSSIERLLLQSVLRKEAVKIRYDAPYITARVFYGFIECTSHLEKPYRMILMNEITGELLKDDANQPQQITLHTQYIKAVSPIHHYQRFTDDTQAKKRLNINPPTPFERYHESLNDYITPYTLDIVQLDQLDKASCLFNGALYQNVLSVIDGKKQVPLIVKSVRYDINHQQYVSGEPTWFNHQHMNKYFKLWPKTLQEFIEQPKAYLDNHKLDTDPEYLYLHRKVNATLNMRTKQLEQSKLNRPLKAYFSKLTPKNLGRKDYCLPYLAYPNAIYETGIILSALKHPVTLYETNTRSMQRIVQRLVETAFFNHQTCLIIDPTHTITSHQTLPGLDLRSNKHLRESIHAVLKLKEPSTTKPLPSVDLDAFFETVQDGKQQYEKISTLKRLFDAFKQTQSFHESIHLENAILTEQNKLSPPTIQALYSQVTDVNNYNNMLSELRLKPRKKLSQQAYQPLSKLLENIDEKNALSTLNKKLKTRYGFKQLKQVFQAVFTSDTKRLPYLKNSFDIVIILQPQHENTLDLMYADKAFLISDHQCSLNFFGDETVPLMYRQTPFKLLSMRQPRSIKRYTDDVLVPAELIDLPPLNDTTPHLANSEVEALKSGISNRAYISVRTPFRAQKRLLRQTTKLNVYTMHEPIQGVNAIFSSTITSSMPQETFDWLKNHPDFIKHIYKEKYAHIRFLYHRESWLKRAGDDPLSQYINQALLAEQHPYFFSQKSKLLNMFYQAVETNALTCFAWGKNMQSHGFMKPFHRPFAVLYNVSLTPRVLFYTLEASHTERDVANCQRLAKEKGLDCYIIAPDEKRSVMELLSWFYQLRFLRRIA